MYKTKNNGQCCEMCVSDITRERKFCLNEECSCHGKVESKTHHPNGARKEMVVLICEDMQMGMAIAREHLAPGKITYTSIAYVEDREAIVKAIDEVVDAND